MASTLKFSRFELVEWIGVRKVQTYLDTSNTIHLCIDQPYTYVHSPLGRGVSDSIRLLPWREIVGVVSYACVMQVARSRVYQLRFIILP